MRWKWVLLVGGSCVLSGCAARFRVPVEVEARMWVCHQDRWQEVGAPAADGHRRHGDRVSSTAQEERASC